MATLNMDALRAKLAEKASSADSEDARANFKAHRLHCKITVEGTDEVVMETFIDPRGFRAKKDNRNGEVKGGVGWYADVRGDDSGSYQGFPVTAGLRLSLDKVKVEPGTTIDLLGDSEE